MKNTLEQFNKIISELNSISADLETRINRSNWSQARKANAIQIARKIDTTNLSFSWCNYKYQAVIAPIEFIVVPNELLASKEVASFTPSVFMYLNTYVTKLIADLNILSDVVQFSYSERTSMNPDLDQPWSYKITWTF